jgi:hypothetical protein
MKDTTTTVADTPMPNGIGKDNDLYVSNRPTTYCGSALHTTADKYPEVSSYWAANHQFC